MSTANRFRNALFGLRQGPAKTSKAAARGMTRAGGPQPVLALISESLTLTAARVELAGVCPLV